MTSPKELDINGCDIPVLLSNYGKMADTTYPPNTLHTSPAPPLLLGIAKYWLPRKGFRGHLKLQDFSHFPLARLVPLYLAPGP